METYIIYLAAGNSRRFGTNKLFYKINDKELYRYGLDNLIKLVSMRNDCKLIVVTQYFEITKAYPAAEETIIARIVVTTEIIREFLNAVVY